MVKRYLLDTNAVLYFLADRFAEPLPEGMYFVSVITEMELLSYPKLTAESKRSIQGMLSKVALVELEKEIRAKAIEIRCTRVLKLPDSIIVASAVVLGATLVTHDERLLGLKHPESLRLKLKQA